MFYDILFYKESRGVREMYPRIRQLRKERGLLQKYLAEHLKCSQVCYSHYEIGKRDIPTDILIKLARFHNVSADYLLGETDKRQRYL